MKPLAGNGRGYSATRRNPAVLPGAGYPSPPVRNRPPAAYLDAMKVPLNGQCQHNSAWYLIKLPPVVC
jgi:hypothetical protein